MTTLRWGSATDAGMVRTINQDTPFTSDTVFAVADGVGGHAAGEVASQVAVEVLGANPAETRADLVWAFRLANRAVISRAEEDDELRGMGTTLCAVALVRPPEGHEGPEQMAVANVGDSRVYLYRDGDLIQLTDDHSLVEEMVRQGRLSPEEARNHPQKNIITRVLGNELDVEVDVWDVEPFSGDRFLLSSDGLFNEVDDDAIAATLRRFDDPDEAAGELVRLANQAGGRDNITVVVVDVVDDGGRARSASAALGAEGRGSSRPITGPTPAVPAPDDEPEAAPPPTDATAAARLDDDLDDLDHDDTAAAGERPRRFTWRVAVFLLAVLVLVGGAAGFTAWYARSTYFVGIEDDDVAIFRGRPGGVLWIQPTLEQRTDLAASEVPRARLIVLEGGKEQPTLAAARRYVENLRDEAETLARTTTTTTAPPPEGEEPPPGEAPVGEPPGAEGQ